MADQRVACNVMVVNPLGEAWWEGSILEELEGVFVIEEEIIWDRD